MAMGIKGNKADINVTPMIDVLLVLLIIFMVIQPSLSVGLDVQVPRSVDGQGRPLPPPPRWSWRLRHSDPWDK